MTNPTLEKRFMKIKTKIPGMPDWDVVDVREFAGREILIFGKLESRKIPLYAYDTETHELNAEGFLAVGHPGYNDYFALLKKYEERGKGAK